METPPNAGEYWNSFPQSLDNFLSGFNQLSLSSNPDQSGLTPHIMTRGQSSTAVVNDQSSLAPSPYHGGGASPYHVGGSLGAASPYHGGGAPTGTGFRQPIASATPMGGGGGAYNAFIGGSNPGMNYQGTFYPNNIGYGDNFVSRMMGEGSAPVIGRQRHSIYENNPNPNPNLNLVHRLSLANNLHNMSMYLSNSNSNSASSSTSTNQWERFCIEQQLINSINNIRSNFFPIFPEANMHDLERSNVYLMARTQQGRRELQKIFDEGVPEKIHLIFCQVKDHVHDLMKHQSGNIMIQKMFEVCNAHQITQLVRCLLRAEHHLMDVCTDNHGTRAMQKLLGYLTTQDQRRLVLSRLKRITLHLTKDANGHHVIERCFDLFPREETLEILNVVAAHCVDIAANKSGCCLLQHCILKEEAIDPRNRIVAEITANALPLSEDQYGNYVVQYIVGLKMDNVTREIVTQLSGNFVSLSLDKYGSHVVEKCIKFCPEDQAMKIIDEMISSQDFLAMLQDPYGNFVAQSAFRVSKGSTHAMMVDLIKKHQPFLHSHPHGKRVLDKIGFHPQGRRLLDATTNTARNCMVYGEA